MLSTLRRRIAAVERAGITGAGAADTDPVPLGAAAVDAALPGAGLPRACVHEILPADPRDAAAAAGFCAALAGRLVRAGGADSSSDEGAAGHLVWCLRRADLFETGRPHGAGLARFGLVPSRILLLAAKRDGDILWAMEEALDCAALSAVIGEIGTIGRVAARRLILKTQTTGVTAFLLRPPGAVVAPGAVTRWRLSAAPSRPEDEAPAAAPGRPRWRAELLHNRGGKPHDWTLEWKDEAHHFDLVAPLARRAPVDHPRAPQGTAPARSRLAG